MPGINMTSLSSRMIRRRDLNIIYSRIHSPFYVQNTSVCQDISSLFSEKSCTNKSEKHEIKQIKLTKLNVLIKRILRVFAIFEACIINKDYKL